jgi:hypothetical protein
VSSRPKERALTDARFAKPLYTVAEASSYLGVPRSTFDTWVRGYTLRPAGRPVVQGGGEEQLAWDHITSRPADRRSILNST